jgi:predicted transcriptional regulator
MYLMSIRPKYAYRIFTGIKKFELRKWFGVKPEEGSIIIVYASGSVRAIIGEFRVGRIIMGKPSYVWDKLSAMESIGVGLEDYQYIRGSKTAMAIEVVDPILYVKPITLEEIRSIIHGFMPPFSFRRLYRDEPLYELIIRKARESTRIKTTG